MVTKTDLSSRTDIQILVDRFYEKVNADPLLAPVFGHINWAQHLPVMYNFWASILLGDNSYQGNPFQAHINLPITAIHFNQWLKLFHETVDENFMGEKADEVKNRSTNIAGVFQHKLGLMK